MHTAHLMHITNHTYPTHLTSSPTPKTLSEATPSSPPALPTPRGRRPLIGEVRDGPRRTTNLALPDARADGNVECMISDPDVCYVSKSNARIKSLRNQLLACAASSSYSLCRRVFMNFVHDFLNVFVALPLGSKMHILVCKQNVINTHKIRNFLSSQAYFRFILKIQKI